MGGLLLLSRVRFCAIDTFCRRQRGDLHIAIFQTGSAIGLAEGESVLEEVDVVAFGTAFIQTLVRPALFFTGDGRVRHTFGNV